MNPIELVLHTYGKNHGSTHFVIDRFIDALLQAHPYVIYHIDSMRHE